jgi:UDP-glucose 4-epimerase
MVTWLNENLAISSCHEELHKDLLVLDVRDLVDGKGNDLDILRSKIRTGVQIIKNGKKVVVCCDMGISRSVAIAIGILCSTGMTFSQAIDLVRNKVEDQSLNLDLLEDIKASLRCKAKKASKQTISKILVTGSSGFIGSSLINRLIENYSVLYPSREEINLSKDILPLYAKAGEVDLIIHLAHPRGKNSIKSMSESVAIMRNLLEVCRLHDLPMIFLSSLAVFDGYYFDRPLTSDLNLKPKSIYGQSKALCEELIELYRKLYGLKIMVLRPSYVYGSGMSKSTFMWKFIKNAIKDQEIIVHKYVNGFQKFDFLSLNDLLDAIECAINNISSCNINLGTGRGLSTFDVAKLIIKEAGSRSKIKVVDIKDKVSHLIADVRKSQDVLNWSTKIKFEDGLRDLIAHVRRELWR